MIKAVAGGGGRGMRIGRRRRRARGGLRALPVRGEGGLRQRRRSTSSALVRARHIEVQIVGDGTRRGQPPVGARVHPPAPPPEARRDRARARLTDACASAFIDAAVGSRARRLRQPRHLRVPRRRRARIDDVLLHRGQPAAAGRAHRHRGGDRRRPRARQLALAAGARWPTLGLAQADVPRRAASRSSCASTWRRWTTTARARPAAARSPFRAAVRARRARRHLRLRRLPHQPASTRCSPRSSSTAVAATSPTRCAQGRGRWRVPHRGRRHQHRLPASAARAPDFVPNTRPPRFIESNAAELIAAATAAAEGGSSTSTAAAPGAAAGVKVDDRSAGVLAYGKSGPRRRAAPPDPGSRPGPPSRRPLQGTIVSIDVGEGDPSRAGQQLLVMEAMKMEHVDRGAEAAASCARSPVERRRHRLRGPSAGVRTSRGRREGDGRRARRRRPRPHPPRPRRGARAPRHRPRRRPGPTRSRAGARPASAPRARTSTTCATRQLRRVRPARRSPRSAAGARSRTSSQHAGRRHDRRHRHASTATCSATSARAAW